MTKISLDGFEKAILCIGLAHYQIKAREKGMEEREEHQPTVKAIRKLEKKLKCHGP